MKPSEYPHRSCREAVFSPQGLAYTCELPELHLGPCMSQSIRDSMSRRSVWEDAHPEQASVTAPSADIIDDPRGAL